jgi:lysophospholipase L1-like esterase
MIKTFFIGFFSLLVVGKTQIAFAQADPGAYLKDIKVELQKQWPKNRTINLVFHGHSVPSGYAKTPLVKTFDSYPFQVLKQLKSLYPYAVINVITTSIGGENSEQGQKRFKRDVLIHKPDVLFIDYALNDRAIGLERSKKAMEKMIKAALKKNIKVVLLTPSPDLTVDLTKDGNVLEQFTNQLIALAKKYNIGLSDSYNVFKALAESGENLKPYMAQSNHPNERGHSLIAKEIMKWFE